MTAVYEQDVDERQFVPKVRWKIDDLRIYDARNIRKEWNGKLRKNVMYLEIQSDKPSVILDFPPATQLMLQTEGAGELFFNAGNYMWLKLTEGNAYRDFLSDLRTGEDLCRPKVKDYRFNRAGFAEFAKLYARSHFEV